MSWRRSLYSALSVVVLPIIPLRLWWRGRREAGYRRHIGERFGRYPSAREPVDVWIHAVSAGETRAAAPLVRALRERMPGVKLLLTHMTATGRETGAALFGSEVHQAYLPYDFPFAVRRFLAHFQPGLGLIMETELWPNLIAEARSRKLPLYLVNARLSARSAQRYARLGALTRETLAALSGVAAQTMEDAQRLRSLGADNVSVTGSVKFDVEVPPAMLQRGETLRQAMGRDRPVWLAATTREGEEALLLDALGALPESVLTVIVPRHPQRFADVADLLAKRGIAFQRRSEQAALRATTRVLLGDSMGEMFAYYAAADVAFVGGSLLPLGGHNLLEACAVGTPVLLGPHTFNFAQASEEAVEAGAALRVRNADELIATVVRLLRTPDERARMASAGRAFYGAQGGATRRTLALVAPTLERLSRSRASG